MVSALVRRIRDRKTKRHQDNFTRTIIMAREAMASILGIWGEGRLTHRAVSAYSSSFHPEVAYADARISALFYGHLISPFLSRFIGRQKSAN